jgi:hypothetical protein
LIVVSQVGGVVVTEGFTVYLFLNLKEVSMRNNGVDFYAYKSVFGFCIKRCFDLFIKGIGVML